MRNVCYIILSIDVCMDGLSFAWLVGCMYVCLSVCMYVCMYVCLSRTYVRTYVRLYIHMPGTVY